MTRKTASVPRSLGDGLVLRWATAADAEELAEFNFRMHNDNPGGVPEVWLKEWTRELMSGSHPTTDAGDFTVVVDRNAEDRIVSTAVLISQLWRYAGQPFGCGCPELIGTDPDYRLRGLVDAQMDLIHARSAERGQLVQAITGIPWFYRQFGYEMAMELSGGRRLELASIPALASGQQERFRLRRAKVDDIPDLARLYEIECSRSLVSCQRDVGIWRHEIARGDSGNARRLFTIVRQDGSMAGYVNLAGGGRLDIVRELVVSRDIAMREVALFVGRWLKARLRDEAGNSPASISGIYLRLGTDHLAYEALKRELGRTIRPYAWYVRVPDLATFLMRIRPALEARLSESAMAGYSGALRLNFYRSQLALTFDGGRLVDVDAYRPAQFFDGDAFFPDLSFLQLLFGYRSLEEIGHIRPDCFPERDEAAVLLAALFPKQPSQVVHVV
ncbi:MAG: GNAT family N-acetyltransferase [Chloroflexota bacterium]|nr:MAG: GNAT family N-acetyltransferase [Chloroflexota bacterium]